nr:MAG TPA: hypothetical protein [Caudoviricetes sp.]
MKKDNLNSHLTLDFENFNSHNLPHQKQTNHKHTENRRGLWFIYQAL